MTEDLAAGARLGPYEVVALLGRGGMGAVYKAHDATLNRHVALKVLHAEFLHEPSFAERFRREAEIWARLEHPHVVPVYFAGIENGRPFLALKLLPGSLSDRLRSGSVPFPEAARVLADVAAALDHAHRLGIVHRDVKPANILLGEDGRGYLSDFGIARSIAPGGAGGAGTSGVVGTPGYMSPEQARSVAPDPRSDVYSLGCVAYEMLTGAPPFRGSTPVNVLMQHISETPTPPRTLLPELPSHAEEAILKAMAKDPADRWPSAGLFVQALLGRVDMHSAATVSLHGHLPSPTPAGATPTRRRWRPSLRLALYGLLAVVLAAGLAFWPRERPQAPPAAGAPPSPQSLETLLAAARRAMDEGAYPEALQIAELSVKLYPGRTEAGILRERVQRAWEAEKQLGLWQAPPASPAPGR